MLKLALFAGALFVSVANPAVAQPTTYVVFQPQVRSLGCLRPRARAMVAQLTSRIGAIEITSTCGGRHAHNSQHYRGNAIDFRPLQASVGTTLRVLRGMSIVGGIGSYSGGLIHADVGTRQAQWHGYRSRRYMLAGHHHRHHARRRAY